eukprot:TCALIF_05473-PA protein Name:"Similar to Abhd14a Alpha/beta hydrolase domain-containing protein 14A (Rattus norvegicus)" AED:0.14 eAED:0.14 QI:1993/0.77/0.7/1/0.66/0.7/10/0/508
MKTTVRNPLAALSPWNWNVNSVVLILLLVMGGMALFSHNRFSDMVGVAWKDIDFLALEIPQDIKSAVKQHPSEIRERQVDIQGLKVAYLEALPGSVVEPSGQTVLLLHGQAFKASTWHRELPTLQTISAMGHRAVAIDLPDLVCGYIPVAPVMTNLFTTDQYKAVHTPTLIVYGERDTSLGRTSAQHLVQIPTSSQPQIIPKARHPCYLDDPDRWHALIFNFVRQLKSASAEANKESSESGSMKFFLAFNPKVIFAFVVLFLVFCFLVRDQELEKSRWRLYSYLTSPLPEFPSNILDGCEIVKERVEIQDLTIVALVAKPQEEGSEGLRFLLLHGARQSSGIWINETKTMQTLWALGHTTVAINLPGYGGSSPMNDQVTKAKRGELLIAIMDHFYPQKRVVVVAPSMAGSYALPALFNQSDHFCGFVPIAPVSTTDYDVVQFRQVQVPTLIVVGETDATLGQASTRMLTHIPKASSPQVFRGLGHACYIEDPHQWLKVLYNFITRLNC